MRASASTSWRRRGLADLGPDPLDVGPAPLGPVDVGQHRAAARRSGAAPGPSRARSPPASSARCGRRPGRAPRARRRRSASSRSSDGGDAPGLVEALAVERLLGLAEPLGQHRRPAGRRGPTDAIAAAASGRTPAIGAGPSGRRRGRGVAAPVASARSAPSSIHCSSVRASIFARSASGSRGGARRPLGVDLGGPPLGRRQRSLRAPGGRRRAPARRRRAAPPVDRHRRAAGRRRARSARLRAESLAPAAARLGAPDGAARRRHGAADERGDPRTWPLDATGRKRRRAPPGGRRSSSEIRRRPTLPGGLPPSTIGADRLNFRVRDGNGCDPVAMATEISCQQVRDAH